MTKTIKFYSFSLIILLISISVAAQQQFKDKFTSNANSTFPKRDSSFLQHRNDLADSITIYYKLYNSNKRELLDSTLDDFNKRYLLPYYVYNMGNYGTAVKSLLFNTCFKAGFDAGFHQYDLYNFSIENTKFYNTTKPFTSMSYLLGSNSEQIIDLLHTQNHKNNFNFSLEYRFSNTPGFLRSQNASNSNMRITAHYQSPTKRYEYYMVFINNKNSSSENGGLDSIQKLNSLALNDPFELDTRLGNTANTYRNPFNTTVNTGNLYNNTQFLFRHHYDFGQKDSIKVNDTTQIKLFYPRLSLQHSLLVESSTYHYFDNLPDSISYSKDFNFKYNSSTISFKDYWSSVRNEFSFLTFPDKKNISQYLKLGIAIQLYKGTFNDSLKSSFHDFLAVGEYRNRTKNNVWDIDASGQLYLNGFHAGDYDAQVRLKKVLSKSIGDLSVGFQNINSSSSYIFTPYTGFYLNDKQNFKKQNVTKLWIEYDNIGNKLLLRGEYFLINNYLYFDSFFSARQYATLFNVLHVTAEKKFKITKHLNWYLDGHLQQATGNAPVNIPLLLMRNRIAFEGNFYHNLFLSTGLEAKYYSNYAPSNYSPFTGQFFYQNSYHTNNYPEVNYFFNFRIKSFKMFSRVENLDALINSHYNIHTPSYPNPALWYRIGIWWNFIN